MFLQYDQPIIDDARIEGDDHTVYNSYFAPQPYVGIVPGKDHTFVTDIVNLYREIDDDTLFYGPEVVADTVYPIPVFVDELSRGVIYGRAGHPHSCMIYIYPPIRLVIYSVFRMLPTEEFSYILYIS